MNKNMHFNFYICINVIVGLVFQGFFCHKKRILMLYERFLILRQHNISLAIRRKSPLLMELQSYL